MTFQFKGIWFSNMQLLATADPDNINHIKSKHFGKYVKASTKLHEIMDVFGDGILTNDSPVWNYHRNIALSFFNNPDFQPSLIQITWKKTKDGLIPLLDHALKHEIEIDLQDVFLRFMYDTSSTILMNHDPNSLSVDLPYFPIIKVVADIEHAIFFRHMTPTCIWKFLRWLNVGEERKQKEAWKTLDNFIYKQIYSKREQIMEVKSSMHKDQGTKVRVDLFTLFTNKEENKNNNPLLARNTNDNNTNNYKLLRDTVTNFLLAGAETLGTALSWFFYLLSKNPQVVHKIKAELQVNMIQINTNDNCESFLENFKELNAKLIYLHATLCETLRMYPPVPFDNKEVFESDILHSGHRVTAGTKIIFTLHAMGRMKSIWGDDCNEFKPERWIEKGGTIKHEPSYKFSVFGAGPRACLGKQMAFTQMKIVAATIIQNYHIEATQQYDHVPELSMVSHMKNGFKVKVHRYLN